MARNFFILLFRPNVGGRVARALNWFCQSGTSSHPVATDPPAAPPGMSDVRAVFILFKQAETSPNVKCISIIPFPLKLISNEKGKCDMVKSANPRFSHLFSTKEARARQNNMIIAK